MRTGSGGRTGGSPRPNTGRGEAPQGGRGGGGGGRSPRGDSSEMARSNSGGGGGRGGRGDNNSPRSGGGGGYHQGRGDYQQQQMHQQQQQQQPVVDKFGMVVSLKEGFGFIQPLNVADGAAVNAEEQIYFADREGYREIAVGHEVWFGVISTPKGNQAALLSRVEGVSKIASPVLHGVCVKEPEPHRNVPGLVQIDAPSSPGGVKVFAFMNEDYLAGTAAAAAAAAASGGASRVPAAATRGARLNKGDELDFIVASIPGSPYLRAVNVTFSRSKREKSLSEQIQRMLDAGAVREQGMVDTIKAGEGYGFMKPADRTGQIYFRFDDFVGQETSVSEGLEVEFFVMVENSKGKMSDRAVHINVLPPGSVQFETNVAVKMTAIVTVEPKVHPREEPGMSRLFSPISREGSPDLVDVELWPRCIPESLVFRVGDVLELDVQNYRPEKIHFARSVKVLSFRKLGRENGRVISIKEPGFGFIKAGDKEIYFRVSEVVGLGGELLPENAIGVNFPLSFDIVMEPVRDGGMRMRAIRLKEIQSDGGNSPSSMARTISSSSSSSSGSSRSGSTASAKGNSSSTEALALVLIKSGVKGVVMRDVNPKRDAPGLIRIMDGEEVDANVVQMQDIVEALEEFRLIAELREIVLDNLSTSQRKQYIDLLLERFQGIAHDVQADNSRGNAGGRVLKLWKLGEAEYAAWLSAYKQKKVDDEVDANGRRIVDMRLTSSSSSSSVPFNDADGVLFSRADKLEELGPVSKDLEVIFDLYVSKLAPSQKMAKNVRVTDEAVSDAVGGEGGQCGILDVVLNGSRSSGASGRYGYIRTIPTDEKLFWHSSGAAAGTRQEDLVEGREVAFTLRRRGGLRTAVDITCLDEGDLSEECDCEGMCSGIVVEDNHVVLIDVSDCPLIRKKLWNVAKIQEIRGGASSKKVSTKKSDSGKMWEKKGAAAAGSAEAEVAAAEEEAEEEPPQQAEEEPSDIKYLSVLPRVPIPIVTFGEVCTLQPGDFVQGIAVANWQMQRHPLGVRGVVKLPVAAAQKRRGTIARLAVRVKGTATSVAGLDGLELCEIRDVTAAAEGGSEATTSANSGAGASYYCMNTELKPHGENSRESIQQGDEVDFFAIPSLNMAVHVCAAPKLSEKDGIVFKRAGVNTSLKSELPKGETRMKAIAMAAGPAEDGSIGFLAGWRPVPSIAGLPWAHLLAPHYGMSSSSGGGGGGGGGGDVASAPGGGGGESSAAPSG